MPLYYGVVTSKANHEGFEVTFCDLKRIVDFNAKQEPPAVCG